MEGKLVKTNSTYHLVIDNKIIASMGDSDGKLHKLSLKNCDAIANGYSLNELTEKIRDEFYQSKLSFLGEKTNKVTLVKETAAFTVGFDRGFKKALELLGDKKFSEGDLREAISQTRKGMLYNKKYEDEYIQSLQQTEWVVEVEMEDYLDNSLSHVKGEIPVFRRRYKLDADGCLILKRR